MADKELLDRITIAYNVYSKEIGPNLSVEQFIEWLYKQYGMIQGK